MKKEYIIIGLVVVVIGLLGIGAYTLVTANAKSDKYETKMRGAKSTFMATCAADNTNKTNCSCMYDYLDDNLTNKEFDVVIQEAVSGKVSDHIWKATRACI